MKTIHDIALADTTTSSTGLSNVQGQQWATKVIQFGEALRRFDQVAIINKWMVGKGDKTVTIPKATSHLTIDTSKSAGEAGLRDTTEMTDLTAVDLTVSASSFKQGAITISKEIALTSRVDLVAQARYKIAQALAQDVDSDLATALEDTSVTNRVYGGDATGVDSLATGDTFSVDLIADAIAKIEANNFYPKYLFISHLQRQVLLKDSAFVNASEYGGREAVLKGEIGTYLGLKIISTTNVPSYSASETDTNESTAQWGAAGRTCIMVGTGPNNEPVSVALAWKEMPSVGYEYDMKRNKHWIYYDQAYATGIIQPKAVCLIKVTNA